MPDEIKRIKTGHTVHVIGKPASIYWIGIVVAIDNGVATVQNIGASSIRWRKDFPLEQLELEKNDAR